MTKKASLLLLLNLYNDGATELDAEGHPVILRDDRDQAQWRQLLNMLERAVAPAAPSELSEALVAAFVEGQLSQSEAEAVELICWSNCAAMQEVVEIHRELLKPLDSSLQSSALQDRLLRLPHVGAFNEATQAGDDNSSGIAELRNLLQTKPSAPSDRSLPRREPPPPEPANGARHDHTRPAASANPVPPAPPIVGPPAVNGSAAPMSFEKSLPGEAERVSLSEKRRQDQRRNRSVAWLGAIGVVALVAVLLAVLWVRFQNPNIRGPGQNEIALPPHESELDTPAPKEDVAPRIPKTQESPNDPADASMRPDRVKSPLPTPNDAPGPTRNETPENASPTNPEPNRPGDGRPGANPNRPARPTYRALAVDWERVEGLVMARAADDQAWQGAHSSQLPVDAQTFVTLPGSWAQGSAERLGRFVMDADTRVSVEAKDSDSTSIRMDRGRFAFTETPQDSDFEMLVGGTPFAVHAQKSAAFAIVQSAPGPQVWVKRGEVRMKNVTLRKGQRARWDGSGFLKAETLKEGTAWFDRAPREGIVRLDKDAQKRLLASSHLHDDLVQLSSHNDLALRRIALGWNVVVNPEQHLYAALRSPDAALRMQASAWLLTQMPREPRMTAVWRRMARQAGDAAKIRQVAAWKALAWRSTPPPLQEAQQMVQGLSNNDPAIRHLCAFFLELNFGGRVKYSPTANPASQRRAIAAWNQVVRQRYSNNANRPTR